MKLYEGVTVIILIIVLGAAAIGLISDRYLGHDNVVEELAEDVIEEQTGMDIDLSEGEENANG